MEMIEKMAIMQRAQESIKPKYSELMNEAMKNKLQKGLQEAAVNLAMKQNRA